MLRNRLRNQRIVLFLTLCCLEKGRLELVGKFNEESGLFVIIPTYEPSSEFIKLIESFKRFEITNIVIVDDGSGGGI